MRVIWLGLSFFIGLLSGHVGATPREQSPPPPGSPPAPAPTPPPAPRTSEEEPAAPPTESPSLPGSPQVTAPLDQRRPGTTLATSSQTNVAPEAPKQRVFRSDYDARPLLLEARFGFNQRLGSSFDSTHEHLFDSTIGLGAYISWSRFYAVGLEFENAGLGSYRALRDQSALDVEYSANGGWLTARILPLRSERWDLFLNLRVGLVWQHADALGTRYDSSNITRTPTSFSCTEWNGPDFGVGGGVGAAFYLSRHFSLRSRVDATADHLSGDALGTCAAGLGSVATVSGTVGLGFEFETAPK